MESLFNEYAKPNSNDKSGQLSSTKKRRWIVDGKCVHCGRVRYYHSHYTGTASLRRHVKCCLENRNQNRQLSRIDD
ncbi:hypothetical protein H5410_002617 [Solanum commersonii]|uniref:BED-type domain-containing protein n=1 Tax=Solanum commersonii TaxID=4109 RepID=A0A9J6B2N1_SOLCO|nr:hypothetical protein H5410_002617 [Solanum commersonii]